MNDQLSLTKKPKLLPTSVPWMISPSAPYLRATPATAIAPATATFIGYFRACDTGGHGNGGVLQFVPEPSEFIPTQTDTAAPYRLIRVTFRDAKQLRVCRAISDHETFSERDYDWSAIPGARISGEAIEETVRRRREWWLNTGLAPDAGLYEVENSPLVATLGKVDADYRHYLLSGHDEYVEVLSLGWDWEAGQPVI